MNSFDIVTLWDVLEHLRDPVLDLEKVYRILKPKGFIIFSTGDISSFWAKLSGKKWQLMTPPQHLFFFSKKSVLKLIPKIGFEIAEIVYFGKNIPLYFLLFKAEETYGSIFNTFRNLLKKTKMDTKSVHINLRDILTCIAKKI